MIRNASAAGPKALDAKELGELLKQVGEPFLGQLHPGIDGAELDELFRSPAIDKRPRDMLAKNGPQRAISGLGTSDEDGPGRRRDGLAQVSVALKGDELINATTPDVEDGIEDRPFRLVKRTPLAGGLPDQCLQLANRVGEESGVVNGGDIGETHSGPPGMSGLW